MTDSGIAAAGSAEGNTLSNLISQLGSRSCSADSFCVLLVQEEMELVRAA